jgi:hypothetical protein
MSLILTLFIISTLIRHVLIFPDPCGPRTYDGWLERGIGRVSTSLIFRYINVCVCVYFSFHINVCVWLFFISHRVLQSYIMYMPKVKTDLSFVHKIKRWKVGKRLHVLTVSTVRFNQTVRIILMYMYNNLPMWNQWIRLITTFNCVIY